MNRSDYVTYLNALNFLPEDRVCIALGKDALHQKFFLFKHLFEENTIAQLESANNSGENIYLGMNPLKPDAQGRTKDDIAQIRHCYIDCDEKGSAILEKINRDSIEGLIPSPDVVVESSPGKLQIIWWFDGSGVNEQEILNKTLQQRYGSDPQTTDAARVLRIPGFANCKAKYPHKPLAKLLEHGRPLLSNKREDFKFPDVIKQLSKTDKINAERDEHSLIQHGHMYGALISQAGVFWNAGLSPEGVEAALIDWANEHCAKPLDYEKIKSYAKGSGWKQGRPAILLSKGQLVTNDSAILEDSPQEEVLEVNESIQFDDMPENAIPDCRLGTICDTYLKNFPRSYSWPAILTVAGAMVPIPEKTSKTVGSNQTNLYTAFVGPVGSGKSQVIEHAVGNLGLPEEKYELAKAGSAEGLISKLSARSKIIGGTTQYLIDLDEWGHLLKKASIENASFLDILTTAYNKTDIEIIVKNQKTLHVSAALSFLGGVVTERFQELFGSSTLGGFYDRFLFGVCPTNSPFEYFPFEFMNSAQMDQKFRSINLQPVKISKSVWELANSWKKKESLGRAVEVTIRCANIVASYDQKTEMDANDLDKMRPFLDYQIQCRKLLNPDPSLTYDAKMTNAILGWLNRHAPNGEWVTQRALKRGVIDTLRAIGPVAFTSAIKNLCFMDTVETKRIPSTGRPSDAIRLKKGF